MPVASPKEVFMSLDLLIAFVLITTPPTDFIEVDPFAHPLLGETIKFLALEMELLDERESEYYFQQHRISLNYQFVEDVNSIRKRHIDLKDAPLLVDRFKFFTYDMVEDCIAFNRAYRQTVVNQQSIYIEKYYEFAEVLREIDELYDCWDLLRDGVKPYYYISVRRYGLKRLKEKIGEEAYNIGAMPPYVPIWRFRKIE